MPHKFGTWGGSKRGRKRTGRRTGSTLVNLKERDRGIEVTQGKGKISRWGGKKNNSPLTKDNVRGGTKWKKEETEYYRK